MVPSKPLGESITVMGWVPESALHGPFQGSFSNIKAGELLGKLMRILQNQQNWQRVVDSISNSWGQARHSIRKNGYSTNSVKQIKALPYPLLLSFGVYNQWELWNDDLASENTWYLCFDIFLIHLQSGPSFGPQQGNKHMERIIQHVHLKEFLTWQLLTCILGKRITMSLQK